MTTNQEVKKTHEITVFKEADPNVFQKLYDMLEQITIPLNPDGHRYGFQKHRAITFGLVRQRATRKIELSRFSKLHPEIYRELLHIADVLKVRNFTSIYLNKNVTCPKHRDKSNNGHSTIVSFGPYTGSELVIENLQFKTRHRPVRFHGSFLEHWNTDDLVGTKYSLVFFSMKEV